MPGLSFICDQNNNVKETEVSQELDAMLYFGQYKKKILLEGISYILGYTNYDEYPLISFENDRYMICLEGLIYGKDAHALKGELSDLAKLIFEGETKRSRLSEWVLNTDGDFIVVFFNKISKEICFLNDSLSRLPLYYLSDKGRIVISREIAFIESLSDNFEFDRMAIAQYLLLGYPLGKKTLYKNVFRLSPSTLIRIDLRSFEIEIDELHRYNFDEKKYHDVAISDNARQLSLIFSESCKNRHRINYSNILSLSGGLDSRSVAAGLNKSNIPFYGATYLDSNRTAILDAKLAEQIANIFKTNWKLFELSPPQGKDFLKLLRIKSGLNYLGMSFILPFFESIKKTYGRQITYFTGDVGSVLRDLRPSRKINDIDEIVKYILLNKQIYSIDDVSAMTRIPKKEIISELKKHILSYPERKWDQKYVHFSVYEECLKWSFEGEDRNRFYFWSTAPLLSIPFFNFVMNCPDDLKSKNTLYREFLLELCPQACRINNANWNLPIISKRLPIKLLLKSIYHRIPLQYRKTIKQCLLKNSNPYEDRSIFTNCIREQLNKSEPIFDYLSRANVEEIIKRSNKLQFNTLFTITSTIEELQCNYSTIEQYSETEFI